MMYSQQVESDEGEGRNKVPSHMRRPPPSPSSWCDYERAYLLERKMESKRHSITNANSSTDPISDQSDTEYPDPSDSRPSILITFQNSASYYTSYMGAGGTRGTGARPKTTDVVDSPQQHKTRPIVVMNDYPSPAPVCVTVNSRKLSYDHSFRPFSGPPTPPVPSGPPGPPVPNLPRSRRESSKTNTLELPMRRKGTPTQSVPSTRDSVTPPVSPRSSLSPSLASRKDSLTLSVPSRKNSLSPSLASRKDSLTPSVASRRGSGTMLLASRSPSLTDRMLPTRTPSLQPKRTFMTLGPFNSASLPRGTKTQPPRSSLSMPALAEATHFPRLEVNTPSARPSESSSVILESEGERRPLACSLKFSEETEESPPQHKPNWLSLNMENVGRKRRTQSVYVAEIWPSLVCILTAVVMTLIIFILVSYFYNTPHPVTRDRIAPPFSTPTGFPPHPSQYPYHYPYFPPPYDPRHQHLYPMQPPPTDT